MSRESMHAIRHTTVLSFLLVVLIAGLVGPLSARHAGADPAAPAAALSAAIVPLPSPDGGREITWSGDAGDGAWSNPDN